MIQLKKELTEEKVKSDELETMLESLSQKLDEMNRRPLLNANIASAPPFNRKLFLFVNATRMRKEKYHPCRVIVKEGWLTCHEKGSGLKAETSLARLIDSAKNEPKVTRRVHLHKCEWKLNDNGDLLTINDKNHPMNRPAMMLCSHPRGSRDFAALLEAIEHHQMSGSKAVGDGCPQPPPRSDAEHTLLPNEDTDDYEDIYTGNTSFVQPSRSSTLGPLYDTAPGSEESDSLKILVRMQQDMLLLSRAIKNTGNGASTASAPARPDIAAGSNGYENVGQDGLYRH